jgi:hypothetical protein
MFSKRHIHAKVVIKEEQINAAQLFHTANTEGHYQQLFQSSQRSHNIFYGIIQVVAFEDIPCPNSVSISSLPIPLKSEVFRTAKI